MEKAPGAPTAGAGATAQLDWWEGWLSLVRSLATPRTLWKAGDHSALNHRPRGQGGRTDVLENHHLQLKPLAFHKHLCFPLPRFPHPYEFSGVCGPGEKETIKTTRIILFQRGPSVVLARNNPQGGCENFQAVLWGQPAGQVHLGQVQENYLQPEKALKARAGNLTTLFMPTVSQGLRALLCPVAGASVKGNTVSWDPGVGGGVVCVSPGPPPPPHLG